jgi:membrane-associated protease RseP (regulator of RpoE activity)
MGVRWVSMRILSAAVVTAGVVGPASHAFGLPIAAPPTGARAAEAAAADEADAADPQPEKAVPRPKVREMKPVRPDVADERGKPAGREGYLGVMTAAVSDELRAQLELPEDCGLVIRKVAPGSPAEKAGLEANDILLEFGGRKVTSPLDFSEMVQGTRGGQRLRLGIVRRGKRQQMEAVIEAREGVAGIDGLPDGIDGGGGRPGRRPGNIAGLPPLFNGPLLDQQFLEGQIGAAIAQGLAQAQAQAAAGPGGTQFQTSTVTINGRTQTTTVATDAAGTIEIRGADGKRTLTIRDAAGGKVHAGPLDKEADYERVPEAWRQKVRDVEARIRGIKPGALRIPGNAL